MSSFFAVLLFLLSAVVCQAAPTGDPNPNPEAQSEQNPSVSVQATESLPPSSPPPSYHLENPPSPPRSPLLSPFNQPEQSSQQPTLRTPQIPIKIPPRPFPRSPQSPLQAIPQTPQCPPGTPLCSLPQQDQSPPQAQLTSQTPQCPPETPLCSLPQPDQSPPQAQPTSQTPKCPPEVPPCPPECQSQPPVSEPQQPPKIKTGWKNGLKNLWNVCLNAIIYHLTDLVVITGEKPSKKPRNSKCILSFGKRKQQHPSKQPTNGNDSDEEDIRAGNVSCFWYKDNRTPAPRTRIASYVTDSNGGRQCNFCCVGEKVIDCSNCLTINCNPKIFCCSCTINVTVVNNS